MIGVHGGWRSREAMVAGRAAWADLASRALEPNIFSDPGFAIPAAQHLSGHRAPRFLTAWDPHDPCRLIGLCCVAAPVPGLPLSAWLHRQATAAFPLLDADQPLVALTGLLSVRSGSRPDGLLMHGLPADGATMRLIQAQPRWATAMMAHRSRAVLRHDPAPPSGKAGKEFRRQMRRLSEQGPVAVTLSSTPSAFDTFLRLEALGWKGRRNTALGQDARRARFARDLSETLVADGCCQIFSLTLGDRPLAMGIVLRSGRRAFFWKTAFDEAFARFSPGAHLADAIGRSVARDPGLDLIDSCAIPDHSMIDRLWPERIAVADVLVAPTPALTTGQRAAVAALRSRRVARAWVKHRIAAIRGWRRGSRHNPTMAGS